MPKQLAVALILMCGLLFISGCGSSHNNFTPQPQPQPTPVQEVTVKLSATTADLLVNQSMQLTATVSGSTNQNVTWRINESSGGTVASGLYQAPWTVGTYHVTATAAADTTKSATATISVRAMTAFLEELPGGTSPFWSVTPILATVGVDGKVSTVNVNDPQTKKPVDTNMFDVALSPDGKTAVFTMPDEQEALNVYTRNSDGTGDTKTLIPAVLNTLNVFPQFSADGKKIVYIHGDFSNGESYSVHVINADGTGDQEIIRENIEVGLFQFYNPTFSPDGNKIAFEATTTVIDTQWWDGIAIINADGSNFQQLTGKYDPDCSGWDETPAFTNDSQQIVFGRVCFPMSGGVSETLYIMNVDGSGLTALYGSTIAGYSAVQPRMLADKVVFSSNHPYPGTHAFDMFSIPLTGGTPTQISVNILYDGFSIVWWDKSPFGMRFDPQSDRLRRYNMRQQNRWFHR